MDKDFSIDDVRLKRAVDRRMLRDIFLEDIVFEFRRRGFQIIGGRGFNLKGRVVFLPASLETPERETGGPETTERDAPKPEVAEGDVGLPAERQGEPSEVRREDGDAQQEESSRPPVAEQVAKVVDRMQRGEGTLDSIQPLGDTSTSRTDGVRAEVSTA